MGPGWRPPRSTSRDPAFILETKNTLAVDQCVECAKIALAHTPVSPGVCHEPVTFPASPAHLVPKAYTPMPTRVKSPIWIAVALILLTACNRPAPPTEPTPGPTPTAESILVPTWLPTNSGIPERLPATSTPVPLVDLVQPAAAVIVSAPALLPDAPPTPSPTWTPPPTWTPEPTWTPSPSPSPTWTPWPTIASRTQTGPCLCGGDLYNCPDFGSQADAQACFAYCAGDPHGLDADDDGVACEDPP